MKEVNIVCRTESYAVGRVEKAKLQAPILDERGRIIGRVVSVFGPVSNPYVKIRIQRKGGKKLYVGGDKKWEKKKKRKKRRSG